MDTRKLIVLLIVFGLMAVTVGIVKLSQSESTDLITESGIEYLAPEGFLKADVAWIEIWRQGAEEKKITVNRGEQGWVVGTRYNAPADETKIENLLDLYKGLMGELRSDQEDLLPDYGLKDKALHIRIVMNEGKGEPVELMVGKEYKFIRKKDEFKVYSITGESKIGSELGIYSEGDVPDIKRWVKKDIMKVSKNDVKKITAVYPDKKLVFERREKPAAEADTKKEGEQKDAKPEFEWVVASGAFGSVKPKDKPVDKILTRLEDLKCTDAEDPQKKAELGLDNPPFKLEVVRNDDTVITLVGAVSKPGGDAYVMIPDQGPHIYSVSNWHFTSLFPKADDVFTGLPQESVKIDSINEVTLVNFQKQKFTIKMDGPEGDVIFPKIGLKQKKDKIKSILKALDDIKAEDYALPETGDDVLGFAEPAASIEIVSKEGQNKNILVGNLSQLLEGYYVKLSWIDGVYVVRKWKLESVFPEFKTLFEANLLTVNSKDVQNLKITTGSDVLEFSLAEGKWSGSDNGKAFEVDPGAVIRYLKHLSPLKVSDVALKEGETIIATVSVQEKDKTYKLFIQKDASGYTLTEAGTAGVYRIDEVVYKRLSATFDNFKAPEMKKTEVKVSPQTNTKADTPQPVLEMKKPEKAKVEEVK